MSADIRPLLGLALRGRITQESRLDINTIGEVVSQPTRANLSDWQTGDAWLGGGTWLYSEPQPKLRRLIDLDGFGWTPIEHDASGLTIAATCKIAELMAWPREKAFGGGDLISKCCNALLGSFKVWNMATVGGNMCLGLPAGPMTSLASALGGTCAIWTPDGGERTMPAVSFVTGDRTNALRKGELLRAIHLPASALGARTAFRRLSLTPFGRSAALLIGTLTPTGAMALTITASTKHPFRLEYTSIPGADALRADVDRTIPQGRGWHDDIHGTPAWRRHVTLLLAEEIRRELANEVRS